MAASCGIPPKLGDAELVTPAVVQALLGFAPEARWLRHATGRLRHPLPYLPGQSGCDKRLRAAAELTRQVTRALATDPTRWTDGVRVVGSTPVERGRSRQTAKRSELAGWARYGWRASHSRWFWGCGCTRSAPCTGCRSASRWPAPRPPSARC